MALFGTIGNVIPKTTLPSGSVLQVVQAVKSDTFSTTVQDTVFVDITGLSVSITPTSASSKILVMVNIGKCSCATNSRAINFRVLRGSTEIGLGDSDDNRVRVSFASHTGSYDSPGRGGQSASYSFLDSPATTSSTTYKIQMSGHDGDATVINRSGENQNSNDAPHARSSSTITLMEIAA